MYPNRNNQALKIGEILTSFKSNIPSKSNKMKTNQDSREIDAQNLWKLFLKEFAIMYGKEFSENEDTLINIKTLIYYFSKDKLFFECQNLRTDITKYPSFDMGLLIMGGYGVGKTDYMKVFEEIFIKYAPNRFRIISTNQVVTDFESCQKPSDKAFFFESMNNGKLLFDDFGSERVANNFGHNDIMVEIIQERYMCNRKTYITCNYKEGCEKDVQNSLIAYNLRYGGRVYDRFFDMVNIIEFKGKSMRGNIKR